MPPLKQEFCYIFTCKLWKITRHYNPFTTVSKEEYLSFMC